MSVLRFLLDEHLSPAITEQVRHLRPAIGIVSMQEWFEGAYLGAEDEEILREACREGWVLVTFDQRTIMPLLKQWGDNGLDHAGVIFIHRRSIKQNDIGGR